MSRALNDEELRQLRRKRNRIRRERQLRRRLVIAVAVLIIIVFSSIGLTSFLSKASEDTADAPAKVYTSIMIPYGSTLNSIGQEYMDTSYYDSLSQYIKEVRFINHLKNDEIKAGNYLIVPVYKY